MVYKVFIQPLCNLVVVLIMWSSSYSPMEHNACATSIQKFRVSKLLLPKILRESMEFTHVKKNITNLSSSQIHKQLLI